MNRNNEDYHSPAVPAMTKTLLEDVKKIFKTTTGTPFLIPTTGIFLDSWMILSIAHQLIAVVVSYLFWLISVFQELVHGSNFLIPYWTIQSAVD